MDLTVQELAALVGGQFAFNGETLPRITGAAAIAEAGEGHITFFGNSRYLPALKRCRATAALVPEDFSEEIPPIAIRVGNPSLAFARVLEALAPARIDFAPGVHPTAIVGRDVELGAGVSIRPYAVIEDGAKIGARTVVGTHGYIGHGAWVGNDCQLAPQVQIAARCLVGNRVFLHSGVVVGSDGFGFQLSEGRQVKIAQIGIVQLDDDVEIGANSTVDRARFGRTWIGEGTKIDNLVQVGHNVVIGKHCIICAQVGISGSTVIGDYVTIAGQAAFVGHIQIGDGAVIAARSGISKDVAPKEIMWGSPATSMREAKEQIVMIRRLPKILERLKRLEQILQENGPSSRRSSETL